MAAPPIFRMLVGGTLRGGRDHPVHAADGALLGYATAAGPAVVGRGRRGRPHRAARLVRHHR